MEAKIIFYSQKHIEPKQRTKFKKELTGHNDSSHGGRYKYRIRGALEKIPHIKPNNASMIIQEKNYKKILKIIRKYTTDYETYTIIVPETHFKK